VGKDQPPGNNVARHPSPDMMVLATLLITHLNKIVIVVACRDQKWLDTNFTDSGIPLSS
jgi:hypothetical protein